MKRLEMDPDVPLAVQQWQSLIAVNYPARKAGVTRHITATEARKLCPDIKLVHVATWTVGETHWSYVEDPSIATSKACLDPYRAEGKKIISIFRDVCPRVEKASVDESFLDLSAMIHQKLLERYPELNLLLAHGDLTENLPLPPQTEVDWKGSHLVDEEEKEAEDSEEVKVKGRDKTLIEWDDIAMGIAADIVNDVRKEVKDKLGYTCSAGVAGNKMLAKLGSGYKKPNQQTIIRNAVVQDFLNTFPFTKIRNLGGKLGVQISEAFNTTQLTELLTVPLPQLQSKLDDDTATWIYNVIRGVDKSEVNPRTVIKSMLSAKSFRPVINTFDEALKWLKIFTSDISSRLEEEGAMEGKRRPKSMTLQHKSGNYSMSRQAPIPMGGGITKERLLAVAMGLLRSVVAEERMWPCMLLSLQVGGFEEREEGMRGIKSFLVSGNMATKRAGGEGDREVKKSKTEVSGIGRILRKMEEGGVEDDELGAPKDAKETFEALENSPGQLGEVPLKNISDTEESEEFTFFCGHCNLKLPLQEQEEHEDWHFAKALMEEERAAVRGRIAASPSTASSSSIKKNAAGASKKGSNGKGGKKGGLEKRQRKLAFGN
ncbi:N-acetyltransferase eso1 [Rhizina undulata]